MIYLRLEAPYEWVDVQGGRVESFGEVPSLDDYPIGGEEEVVGVVAGEWVTSHRVSLPAKTRKQFNAALPYALEEQFAEDVEDLHFVSPKWQVDQPVTVYSVAKSKLAEWSQIAKQYSIPATRIVPDYLLLPNHDVAEFSLAMLGERALAKSSNDFGVSLDTDLVALWLKESPIDAVIAVNNKEAAQSLLVSNSERDIRHWPFGERLSHWLEYPNQTDINVWSAQYRPRSRKSLFATYFPAAALSSLAILVLIVNFMFNYFSLHREIEQITNESQALVKRLVPELDFVTPGQERMIVERVLSQGTQGPAQASLPRMMVGISSVFRIERSTLKEVRYSQNELTVSAYLSSLGQVESVRQRLQALNGYQVKLQGTSTENNATVATFVISVSNNLANAS